MINHILVKHNLAILFLGLLLSFPVNAWLIHADFESGSVGTKAEGSPDSFSFAAGDTKYVDTPTFSGKQAASVYIEEGQTGFGTWGGGISFPEALGEGDEIWFQVSVFYPAGWDFSCGGCTEGMKFMRVHTQSSGGANEGYLSTLIKGDTTSGYISVNTEVVSSGFDFSRGLGSNITRDRWHTFEMYIKFSSDPNIGRYRVWQNGALINDQGVATLRSSSSTSNLVYVYTYWNSGAPKTQTSYIDNIIITDTTPKLKDRNGYPFIGVVAPLNPSSVHIE